MPSEGRGSIRLFSRGVDRRKIVKRARRRRKFFKTFKRKCRARWNNVPPMGMQVEMQGKVEGNTGAGGIDVPPMGIDFPSM